MHRRSQDFVWGCTFLPKKVDDFFSRRFQRLSKYTSKSSKNYPKIDSCSGWGCTSCPGGALTHFSCKLGLKKFFTALGVQVSSHCTPWLRLCFCAIYFTSKTLYTVVHLLLEQLKIYLKSFLSTQSLCHTISPRVGVSPTKQKLRIPAVL